MFDIEIDTSGIDKFLDKLKKDMTSVKGARAGVIQDKKYENGMKLSRIALIQEFGATIPVTPKMRKFLASQGLHLRKDTTTITIPSRPFFRQTIKKYEKEWFKLVNELLDANQDTGFTLEQVMGQVASVMASNLAMTILHGSFKPNHPFTESRKQGDRPLIDSGLLYDSIQGEVIKKKW